MNPKISLRTLLIFGLLFATIVACSAHGLRDQIIGQWKIVAQNPNGSVVFSFKEDGSLKIWIEDVPLSGFYEWVDENTIQMTIIREDAPQEIIGDVQINGDRMTIASETGEVDVLTRVK